MGLQGGERSLPGPPGYADFDHEFYISRGRRRNNNNRQLMIFVFWNECPFKFRDSYLYIHLYPHLYSHLQDNHTLQSINHLFLLDVNVTK